MLRTIRRGVHAFRPLRSSVRIPLKGTAPLRKHHYGCDGSPDPFSCGVDVTVAEMGVAQCHQAILGRNLLSPEFPCIEWPPKGAAISSQCSKMVIRCHTQSIAVPILKSIVFGLMTKTAYS